MERQCILEHDVKIMMIMMSKEKNIWEIKNILNNLIEQDGADVTH
jgi:hypothetical protein